MNYLEILMLIAALSSHSSKIRENLECIRIVRFSQGALHRIVESKIFIDFGQTVILYTLRLNSLYRVAIILPQLSK